MDLPESGQIRRKLGTNRRLLGTLLADEILSGLDLLQGALDVLVEK